jgi:uncharacterized membrane protein YphA (DoxX/SURF4 family)
MEKHVKVGRFFYAFAMAAVGFQQFFTADIDPMLLPPKHSGIPGFAFLAYFVGFTLLASGTAIIFEKKARTVSLILGGVLLAVVCFYYLPYELIVDPHHDYFGNWGDAEKELALSGGALVVAGSFPADSNHDQKHPFIRLLEKLIPFGGLFFSITMISFGIDHFLYTKYVASLVPPWIPGHKFWTYFAAVALIGSGIAIILKIKLRVIATLLGAMIFLWFIFLHLPKTLTPPLADKGSELTSAFSALAFSGIAFVIAGCSAEKRWFESKKNS